MIQFKHILTVLILLFVWQIQAQTVKKVTFVGGARSEMTGARFTSNDSVPDTVTNKRNSGV